MPGTFNEMIEATVTGKRIEILLGLRMIDENHACSAIAAVVRVLLAARLTKDNAHATYEELLTFIVYRNLELTHLFEDSEADIANLFNRAYEKVQ